MFSVTKSDVNRVSDKREEDMSKLHWSTALKAENATLKLQLGAALLALRTIPQGRLAKAHKYPYQDSDSQLAYVQCAEEVSRLGRAAVERMVEADDVVVREHHEDFARVLRIHGDRVHIRTETLELRIGDQACVRVRELSKRRDRWVLQLLPGPTPGDCGGL